MIQITEGNPQTKSTHRVQARMPSIRHAVSVPALLIAWGCGAHSVLAQQTQSATNQPAVLQEVVVTAQKRSENLQNVPVAVTAISASDALRQGLTGTDSLTSAVPGLVMTNPANVGNPYLRGVGSALFDPSSEQSVAMYIDGVYIASPEGNIFNFNNIQQVEVLDGPQGTLFGRNATGGVITITTKDPSSKPKSDISIGYGNYGDVQATGYITGGIVDNVSADLAVRYENQADGYGRDITTGAKAFQEAVGNFDIRAKLLYNPTDSTKIVFSADYSHSVETNAYQKPPGVSSPLDGSKYPGQFNSNDDLNDKNTVDTGGGSVKIDQDVGNIHLTNILAYRQTSVDYYLDDDVTALAVADIVLHPRLHNWSEEFQIAGRDAGWLKWIAGAYYYNALASYSPVVIDNAEQIADSQAAVAYAGFGQVTADILPRTDVTLGVRYTSESQKYNLTFPATLSESQKFSKLNYRLALDYHFSDDVSGYVSYNTGFKSGGYNLLQPGNSFNPETLDAYEVGLKNELLDHRLRLNIDAFYYDDQNVQVLSSHLGGTVTSNAAAATIKGIEAQFQALPFENLTISGGLSLQEGKYTNYPNAPDVDSQGATPTNSSGVPLTLNDTGKKTLITPPASGNISVSYKYKSSFGSVEPTLTAIYNSGFYWQADNRITQPSYTLLNISVLWTAPDKRYDVRLWGKNLTNSVYYIARLSAAGIGDVQEQAPPRTYGVTVSAHF